jgi:hypothetical protein
MDLGPLYKSYSLFFNGAGCLFNLFLMGLFLYAHHRYRDQRGFPLLAFSNLCFAFTTAYLFASNLHNQHSIDLFPFAVWRALAYAFFVVEPLGFISCLLGPLVLVRTYGAGTGNPK